MITKQECIEFSKVRPVDSDLLNLLIQQNTSQFDMNLLIQYRGDHSVTLELQPSCPDEMKKYLANIMAGFYAGSGWSCFVDDKSRVVFQ